MSLRITVGVTIAGIDGIEYVGYMHAEHLPFVNDVKGDDRVQLESGAREMAIAATRVLERLEETKAAIHEQANVLSGGLLDASEREG